MQHPEQAEYVYHCLKDYAETNGGPAAEIVTKKPVGTPCCHVVWTGRLGTVDRGRLFLVYPILKNIPPPHTHSLF